MFGVRTAARAMLAAIFVVSGADAVMKPERLVPRAKPVTDFLAPTIARVGTALPGSPRLPTKTRTLVQVNGGVQVLAGLLMLTPLRRPAAVALAASMVPTTIAGHAFWKFADPADRAQHRVHFLKNVGLLGGLVLAAADTEGQPGLRWRAGHLAHTANDSVHRVARQTRSKARIARRAAVVGHRLPG